MLAKATRHPERLSNLSKHNQIKKKKAQNTCLTTTAHREVAQTLVSNTSEWGLGREVHDSSLG